MVGLKRAAPCGATLEREGFCSSFFVVAGAPETSQCCIAWFARDGIPQANLVVLRSLDASLSRRRCQIAMRKGIRDNCIKRQDMTKNWGQCI